MSDGQVGLDPGWRSDGHDWSRWTFADMPQIDEKIPLLHRSGKVVSLEEVDADGGHSVGDLRRLDTLRAGAAAPT
jgi:hypothetical protein